MPTDSSAITSRPLPRTACGTWALHEAGTRPGSHEYDTLDALSRRLARLLGRPYLGARDSAQGLPPGPAYLVPERTLTRARALSLGVLEAGDLFGGVVPSPVFATKLISHPLEATDAVAPHDFPHDVGARVHAAVLPGLSVFSAGDARRAYRRLRDQGPLRLKLARGIGGRGQVLLEHADDLDAALDGLPDDELPRHGASIELHLFEPRTFSVGWAVCGQHRISYVGSQRTVANARGEDVYGGSDLLVARGGFARLEATGLEPPLRDGLHRAREFHAAVSWCAPGFFASRCNYDVIHGRDQSGRTWTGVLEQSWRIGGASPAEIAALHAFADDGRLDLVHASSHEVHGPCIPPAGADVHYHGTDPAWGEMTKYSMLSRHGH